MAAENNNLWTKSTNKATLNASEDVGRISSYVRPYFTLNCLKFEIEQTNQCDKEGVPSK